MKYDTIYGEWWALGGGGSFSPARRGFVAILGSHPTENIEQDPQPIRRAAPGVYFHISKMPKTYVYL